MTRYKTNQNCAELHGGICYLKPQIDTVEPAMDSKEGEKERENKNRDFITERRISGRMNVVIIKNTTDRCEFIPALYRFKFHSTRISRESYNTKRILLNIPGTKPIHVTRKRHRGGDGKFQEFARDISLGFSLAGE